MSFILGLDVGTASGAGATKRDGRIQPCALGDRTATLPSVVVLHDDGSTLVGEEAERIAGLELTRVARDVRNDPAQQSAPIVVAGRVHTPHELLRTLYSSLVERVCVSQNATPSHVVLTHPPVPDGARCDTVERVAEELFPGAMVVPEPIAATVKLACDGSLPSDCTIVVYDLGGGTFDATLVRREGDRFSVIGDPTGMPSFGGIDIDDLVLDYVDRGLDGAIARLDLHDPAAMAALTVLRAECRDAKERLSYEPEVTIDASLPGAPALLRLTRTEFDGFLLPNLDATVDLVEQMITDAGLQPDDIDAIALVGGSSRIPLVADLFGVRTSVPILVDPYPELTVALGAAQMVDDETPTASVFPFADLALPSLSALAAGSAVGAVTPSGGLAQAVGTTTSGEAATPRERDEFDALMDRGRDLDAADTTLLVGDPDTAPTRAVGQGMSTKTGVAVLAGAIGVLLVAVLLLGVGGGGGSDRPETAGARETADSDDTTTSSSSSSTTSETTSTTEDGAVVPGLLPGSTTTETDPTTTTEEDGTTTTTSSHGSNPLPPGSTTSSSTSTSTSTTTTSTSTTTTSTTTSTTQPTSTTASTEPTPEDLTPTSRDAAYE